MNASRLFARTGRPLACCVALATSQSAIAASAMDYLVEVTGGLHYIDNPRLINAAPNVGEEDSEVMTEGVFHASVNRATGRVQTSLDYRANKLDYRNDLIQDRTFITGNGVVRVSAGPEGRFAWSLSNMRSMQVIDSFQPDTLDNRQVVSITTTGPEWSIPVAGRHRISGFYNYSYAEYENETLPTQDRQSGQLQYQHTLSSRLALTLGATALDTKMSDGFPGFTRYVYSVGSQYASGSLGLSLSVGETQVERDVADDISNFMIDFNANYAFNSRLSATLQYTESMEDMFSNLQFFPVFGQQPPPVVDSGIGDRIGNSNLTQIYERINLSFGITYAVPESLSMNFGLSSSERNFDGDVQTIHEDRANAGVSIPLGTRTTLSAYARYSEFDFPGQARVQDRLELGLVSSVRFGQRLLLGLRASTTRQDGTLAIDNYDGFNAGITLTYRIGG